MLYSQCNINLLYTIYEWLNFFPNSRALLLTFRTNCPHGSHFAQIGSHFAQNNSPNFCSLLSCHTPLAWICMYTKYTKAHPKTPLFLAWTWKWANYSLGSLDPYWAKCLKSGQNFSRSGQKQIIHHMQLKINLIPRLHMKIFYSTSKDARMVTVKSFFFSSSLLSMMTHSQVKILVWNLKEETHHPNPCSSLCNSKPVSSRL